MVGLTFIGFGNVNYNLCKTLYKNPHIVVNQIYNRSVIELPESLSAIPQTNNLTNLLPSDIMIIGVSDDAIAEVGEQLTSYKALIVHTSGTVSMDVLEENERTGVFYPLQSFGKQKVMELSEIPICLEANNENDLKLLIYLGELISSNIVLLSSEERSRVHLAAVFVNNFVNHLYSISEEILAEHQLDFNLLKPLIIETALKVVEFSPNDVQTGPAKRNDKKTIEKHLHLLGESPHKDLYVQFTEAIQAKYGKKL